MTHFYRQLLEQNEEQHNATIAATQSSSESNDAQAPHKRVLGPSAPPSATQNLTITKPTDYAPDASQSTAIVSDLELARRARAEGKEVELNDDNQIVDKRELLSAGLNLAAPNTRRLELLAARKRAGESQDDSGKANAAAHRAVGSAATLKEINERRRREIEVQLAEESERTRMEKEERERERAARMVAKRNTEEDVQSAKERYLERKRRKLEMATAEGAAEGTT